MNFYFLLFLERISHTYPTPASIEACIVTELPGGLPVERQVNGRLVKLIIKSQYAINSHIGAGMIVIAVVIIIVIETEMHPGTSVEFQPRCT